LDIFTPKIPNSDDFGDWGHRHVCTDNGGIWHAEAEVAPRAEFRKSR